MRVPLGAQFAEVVDVTHAVRFVGGEDKGQVDVDPGRVEFAEQAAGPAGIADLIR